MIDLHKYIDFIGGFDPIKYRGEITRVIGLTIESHGPPAASGNSATYPPQMPGSRLKSWDFAANRRC